MHSGEDLHVRPPWVGGQGAGAGLVHPRVQGAEAAGFHPEADELEDVGEDKIQYKSEPKKNIKTKKNKKKHKIENPPKKDNDKVPLTLITVNANGLKTKIESLKSIVKHLNAGIFTVQETNFRKKGKLNLDQYDVFEAIRKKEGGGTLVGVHKTLDPVLIEEESDENELVVVEITVGGKRIRIMSGYGPQECWPIERRLSFFQTLEEEVVKAELAGTLVIISMDANSKMGSVHIPGDPNQMSENGKVLEGVLERHALVVANGLDGKVSGIITRERTTTERSEKSAIDLVCISKELEEEVDKIEIDEEKKFVLEKITKTKKKTKVVQSDHNTIISKFKLTRKRNVKVERKEMFNLKNKEAQQVFKNLTSERGILTSRVKEDDTADTATKKFLKRLGGCIQQSFKKIRVTENKEDKEIVDLFEKRRHLKAKDDKRSKEELVKVEGELADKCAEANYKKVQEEIKDIEDSDNGFNAAKLWKLKKKLAPQTKEPPVSMCDSGGNIITSSDNLKKHTIEHYKKILENRPINKELEQMKEDKEELCEKRIEKAKTRKSEPWKMKDLEDVLKYLKKKKSRDPNDLANEVFHYDTAGDDMKQALLNIMNKIKDELVIPKSMENAT